ncbi:hypothetical protein G6M89_02415 [Natronolimnobius sp. AArcel1]|uniref:hypothetical protein n=1 Tax=Natronolimnobius sp. AArcel1 TaxID=1679093 RepID=UPI0013EC4C7A|nr:hypothetical protein [Natronolimnobius sp. AArcel1]NGM67874.1 hypothetical protein [Natronolimnobius sp. AArcel1]
MTFRESDDNNMFQISYVLYTIGTVGSGAGVFTTLTGTEIINSVGNIGPAVLFISIALLWVGVYIESIEASIEA